MTRTDYNIVDLSIHNGLKNRQISASKNYIILLEAPPNANVTIKLNENTADEIPLKENFAINAKNIKDIFVSCNAIENEKIKIGTSSTAENFKIITAPVVKDIESINSINQVENFSSPLLAELDKVINPYSFISHNGGTVATSTSFTTVYTEVLTCDKIEIHVRASFVPGHTGASHNPSTIYAMIDGNVVVISHNTNSSSGMSEDGTKSIVLENINGKTLSIVGNCTDGARRLFYLLKKYNLKA